MNKKAMIWLEDDINPELAGVYYIVPAEDVEEKIDLFNCYCYKFPTVKNEVELLKLIPGIKDFDDKYDLEAYMNENNIEYEMTCDAEIPDDVVCYDYHLKEIFNLNDCDTTLVYEYWDGRNFKEIWFNENISPTEIVYGGEPIDIDQWDGNNFYFKHKFNHGIVYKLIEFDGEKADDNEYILYEYTQYQGNIPTMTFITEKEKDKLAEEA